jgi:hypothetical protein
MCHVLIGLNFVSFFYGRWIEVLFGYMPISVVLHVIESKTKLGKNKVVETERQNGI